MISTRLFATAFAVWKTFFISAETVADGLVGRLSPSRCDDRLSSWGRALLTRAAVDLQVEGLENLPSYACLFMSNHQSHYDIPILYTALPRSLRMVAKAELFKVPIWGRAMRDAGFVSVDRSGDRQQAEKAMRLVKEALKNGFNVWIAPEGTRSPDGRLGRFKKGGFILAIETDTPIVPVAISGSAGILPKKSKLLNLGVPVRVWFGKPIDPQGRSVPELMESVRSFLGSHLPQSV
jgi:1-acyl-sn-glycerol-3-phosphate acyltransferase